jgi:hypothetical protein
MWADDKPIKRAARRIANLIADHHGGSHEISELMKFKFWGVDVFKDTVCEKIVQEYKTSPTDALEMWIIITRLLKGHILEVAGSDLKFWLQIPQVPSFL